LFDCDAADKRNLFFLREAGLHIRDISGISCESWDILKLAIAVKVICCPDEEITDFHEVNHTYYCAFHGSLYRISYNVPRHVPFRFLQKMSYQS
jgi:hypothetical protein